MSFQPGTEQNIQVTSIFLQSLGVRGREVWGFVFLNDFKSCLLILKYDYLVKDV